MRKLVPSLLIWLVATACSERTRPPVEEGAMRADEAANLLTRRIWHGDVDLSGMPSPDGSLLSFADWSTGNLAVRDLLADTNRPLTGKQSWDDSPSFPEFSVFSPDGRQIAFAWFAEDWKYDLRVIDLEGGEPRVILRNDELMYVRPWVWTSDGRSILASLVRRDQTVELALIPAQGGAPRLVRQFGWRPPRGTDISPDRRFVVFDVPRSESRHRNLVVLGLESGREWPLVSHASESFVLGWTPDGRRILFASDRAGTMGIWAIRVVNGRPAGEPALLQPDVWQILPVGFAEDGTFFYGLNTGNRQVFSVSVDPRTGLVVSPPTALRSDAVPGIAAGWSPDGRYMASATRAAGPGTPLVIRIHDTAGHQVRDLPTTFSAVWHLVWAADGGSLFLDARDEQRRRGVFRFDLAGGNLSVIVPPDETLYLRSLSSSPDGSALFFVRAYRGDGRGFAIVRFDLRARQETVLRPAGPLRILNHARLSPDGRWLAFGEHPSLHDRTAAIRVMPSDGGPPREVYRQEEPILTEITWSPDGRFLLFGKRTGEQMDAEVELWRVSVAGGDASPLGISAPALRDLHFHPDGRRLIYTAGQHAWELWVMEGLGAAE